MSKTCILVADRARARLFVWEPPLEHRPGAARRLLELETLVDPEGEMKGNDLFSSTRSGTNHAASGATYEYDDHREHHRRETERRFARRVAVAAADFARNQDALNLVVVAEPHMLGMLREVLPSLLPSATTLSELAKDLSWQSPEHIQMALTRHHALPAPLRSRQAR